MWQLELSKSRLRHPKLFFKKSIFSKRLNFSKWGKMPNRQIFGANRWKWYTLKSISTWRRERTRKNFKNKMKFGQRRKSPSSRCKYACMNGTFLMKKIKMHRKKKSTEICLLFYPAFPYTQCCHERKSKSLREVPFESSGPKAKIHITKFWKIPKKFRIYGWGIPYFLLI